MIARHLGAVVLAWTAIAGLVPTTVTAQPDPDAADAAAERGADDAVTTGSRFDLEAVQGILSVQRLSGWLLYDRDGQNPIARELVNPDGEQTRRWFYFVPARGQPTALVHRVDAAGFAHVPGRVIEYAGYREFEKGLRQMLKGVRTVAMEYSSRAALPSLSRVDAGTIELVRSLRVKVRSSADLVQFAKALWGPAGRKSHYVAAHHLAALRAQTLDWVARQVRQNARITEYDVQQFITRGYKLRGLDGPPPVVAVSSSAATPWYRPAAQGSARVKRGDLLLLDMAARVAQAERPIYATTTWVAYVGESVPAQYSDAFTVVARARDAAVELIKDRVSRRRPVKGFEVDKKAREVITKAGHGERFVHRTGHSIDITQYGDGANLDDYETHDTRVLVMGAGFAIEPGIYFKGEFGVRTAIDVYIGRRGVEVTTPAQAEITPILGKKTRS